MADSLFFVRKAKQNIETRIKKVGIETIRVQKKLGKYNSRHDIFKVGNSSTDQTIPYKK